MAQKIQVRRDTASEWQLKNPILSNGEIGIVIDNGEVIEFRIGNGSTTWNNVDTPLQRFFPFKPIKTTTGRDLDAPTTRNKVWDLKTMTEAFEAIFNPYAPPSLYISSTSIDAIPVQEVGKVYNLNSNFSIGINNHNNVLNESGYRKLNYKVFGGDVTGTTVNLPTNTASNVTMPTSGFYNLTTSVTANTATSVPVVQASVKRSDNQALVSAVAKYITYRYRVGWFVHPKSDPIFGLDGSGNPTGKTDVEIMNIISDNLTPTNKLCNSYLSTTKTSGDLPVTVAEDGLLYDFYCYYPISFGTTTFLDPIQRQPIAGIDKHFTFIYTHGSSNPATPNYKLTKYDASFGGDMTIILS